MWPSTSSTAETDDANQCPEYVVISYPGVVKNVDRALESFGGLQRLSVSHFTGGPLEFNYRPENKYSTTLLAERCSVEKANAGLGKVLCVISVRRKKSDPSIVRAKVMGTVSTTYSIKTMCDFQYLPLRKTDPSQAYFDDMVPKLIPTDLSSALSWWKQADSKPRTSLHLPPYQFSRHTVPATKMLCKETEVSPENAKHQAAGFGGSRRIERKALTITVHGTDEFPTAPSENAIKDAEFRCKHGESHEKMKKLFEERPMWSRVGIAYMTGFDDTLIKSLLQKYAFYILNGPWGRLWCRFGYDPRIDSNAKIYQTVMVTFRQHSKIPERQRLMIGKAKRDRISRVALTSGISMTPPLGPMQANASETIISHIYTPGELPRVRQMWYCICDVKLPVAEEIVLKSHQMYGEKADELNGWLPPKAIDRVRKAIKEDVKKSSIKIDEIEGVSEEMDEDWWGIRD